MSRIVIAVEMKQPDPNQPAAGVSCNVLLAPFNIPQITMTTDVHIEDVAGFHGPDVVKQVGQQLAERIRQNQKIDQVLSQALAAQGQESLPILFRVSDPTAYTLSWEALWTDNRFLALEDRWPVGRVPADGAGWDVAKREYAAPLRLVAVVSALGRPGLDEWTGIYQQVVAARQAGLPIEVTVITGEDAVIADVQAKVDAGDAELTLSAVPDTATELIDLLEPLDAHMVHFYCHGAVDDSGVHYLDVGTVNDWLGQKAEASVRLDVKELGRSLGEGNTWVAVLNTCRGAAGAFDPDELAWSHAEQLVTMGVPAAIGMRRLVDQDDAAAFSKAFYGRAFEQIRAAIDGDGTVEWADTLVTARRILRDLGGPPASHDRWTVPVLFTTAGKFELLAPNDVDAGILDSEVAGLLRLLAGRGGDVLTADLVALQAGG